ncbi:MAG: ferritin-like domain-containing protein [Sphingomonas sp.]
MPTYSADQLRSFFITGLRDAHALEHEALALMDRQLNHLANYPQVSDRLHEHRRETEGQIQRLEEILDSFDVSRSVLKDAALTLGGNLAALAHAFAPDEILKNSFANFAFENFEAASYTSLITVAEIGNFSNARPLLEQTLGEERRMASWIEEHQAELTRQYLERRAAGETASH